MFIYRIKIGDLREGDIIIARNLYSGDQSHFNDPLVQNLQGQGPIPEGVYTIGTPRDTPDHGPYFIPLTAVRGEETYGRSAFGMHGDEIANIGKHLASHGCIIAPPDVRHKVGASVGHLLVVLSGNW